MECSSPVEVFDPNTGEKLFVRCRHCYECLQNRSSEWVSRLLIERDSWQDTYFFTLTYNEDSVPWNQSHTRRVVSPEHISKFTADLRQRFQQRSFHFLGQKLLLPATTFKYYITSEYGSQDHTERPHYHGIFYVNCEDEYLLFCLFTSVWNKGIVDFQRAGEKAAGYVSKYLVKYDLDEDTKSAYIFDEDGEKVFAPLTRCFSRMSKGIGSAYFSHSARLDWHRLYPQERGYIPMPGGVKLPMPRYFTQKIFDDDMRQARAQHMQSESAVKERAFLRLPLSKQRSLLNDEQRAHLERVRQAVVHYKRLSILHKS